MNHETVPDHPGVPRPDDMRASSDRMLELVDQLRQLESEKRRHVVGSPDFVDLAAKAEALSRLIFRWSQMQGAMAEDAAVRSEPEARLVDVPPRPIHRLLADWREAELRLVAAAPGSPEAETASNEIERIRTEYHALMNDQRAAD